MYYLLMIVLYVSMYYLTLISFWFAILSGIFTAGVGSILSFVLANKFFVKFPFDKLGVFFMGGLSFLILDIFLAFQIQPMGSYMSVEEGANTLFGDIFIFWHPIVGVMLTSHIIKKKQVDVTLVVK